MGRRGRRRCQDVNRKNKSPFSRCVMAQNGFPAGDGFFHLRGGGGKVVSNFQNIWWWRRSAAVSWITFVHFSVCVFAKLSGFARWEFRRRFWTAALSANKFVNGDKKKKKSLFTCQKAQTFTQTDRFPYEQKPQVLGVHVFRETRQGFFSDSTFYSQLDFYF